MNIQAPQVIWDAVLDGHYDCQCVRATASVGALSVVDTNTGDRVWNHDVSLFFGAQFGPDLDDVRYWRMLCEQAVKAHELLQRSRQP